MSYVSLDDIHYLDVDTCVTCPRHLHAASHLESPEESLATHFLCDRYTWHNPALQLQRSEFAPSARSLHVAIRHGSRYTRPTGQGAPNIP